MKKLLLAFIATHSFLAFAATDPVHGTYYGVDKDGEDCYVTLTKAAPFDSCDGKTPSNYKNVAAHAKIGKFSMDKNLEERGCGILDFGSPFAELETPPMAPNGYMYARLDGPSPILPQGTYLQVLFDVNGKPTSFFYAQRVLLKYTRLICTIR
jgi:hypothetical protein